MYQSDTGTYFSKNMYVNSVFTLPRVIYYKYITTTAEATSGTLTLPDASRTPTLIFVSTNLSGSPGAIFFKSSGTAIRTIYKNEALTSTILSITSASHILTFTFNPGSAKTLYIAMVG